MPPFYFPLTLPCRKHAFQANQVTNMHRLSYFQTPFCTQKTEWREPPYLGRPGPKRPGVWVLCNWLLLNLSAFISLSERQGPSHPPLGVEVIHVRNFKQDPEQRDLSPWQLFLMPQKPQMPVPPLIHPAISRTSVPVRLPESFLCPSWGVLAWGILDSYLLDLGRSGEGYVSGLT